MGLNAILVFLALLGFLPLIIIIYKRRRVKKILTTGIAAKARVYNVYTTIRQPQDIVYYTFYDQHMKQFTGILTTKPGVYKIDDIIDIYYLGSNPKRSAIQGAWKSPVILVFGIVMALFILFAVYKLYEMIQTGQA